MATKHRVRMAITGVGNRTLPRKPETSSWLGWAEQIRRSEDFELVAAHDVAEEPLARIVGRGHLGASQVFRDLDKMLSTVQCDAMLVANPAEHHAAAVRAALGRGLHILVEKPFVSDVAEGKALLRQIAENKVVAAVVQNWRYKDVGRKAREAVQGGMLGRVGHVFFRYVRDRENPGYPPYIFEEKYPLLYAMGIHHFDLIRFVLAGEFACVSGHSFKPPWSLYKSDTGTNLFLKTKNGVSVIYSGTISSKNSALPQESLIIEGEKGTLHNESQWSEPPLWFYPRGEKKGVNLTADVGATDLISQYNIADEFILKNFHGAILGDKAPLCPAGDGLNSVAAVEAARMACETGREILIDEIMERA